MEPLFTALALGPLAAYLILLGVVHLSRRPLLTTGGRDLAALGLGLSGLMAIGPMDLFLPETAAMVFGPYVWLLMFALYGLCLVLWIEIARPRLVVYRISLDGIRRVLARVMERQQLEHHWAGESLALPSLGVQLHLESFSLMNNVSLVANASRQNIAGWRWLTKELAAELRHIETPRGGVGIALITFGLAVIGVLLARLIIDPDTVVQSLWELLRF